MASAHERRYNRPADELPSCWQPAKQQLVNSPAQAAAGELPSCWQPLVQQLVCALAGPVLGVHGHRQEYAGSCNCGAVTNSL
eukprot:1136132-Pelagomonas_calceolata.AAC.2